ncbi:MAG TPA: class I SAM-dependent methyltransferase [Gemmatimonadales bacterium]|nr:class I SAM-dependent methyltransferase [Gemmatimonadales bacterium]
MAISSGNILSSAITAEAERYRAAHARRTGDPRGRNQPSWAAWGYVFSFQDRERHALALLKQYGFLPLAEKSILDVGCGSGAWIRQFVRWGAQPKGITGLDLQAESLSRAQQSVPAGVRLHMGNAAELPFTAAAFDLVLQSLMFTSVLDADVRRTIAAEMLRVVKPNGLILWYDFHVNNPRNPDVRRVTKREIRELFPDCRLDLRRVTLAPPLMRRLAPRSWLVTYLLGCIPPLCTHYLGAIMKRAQEGRPGET